MIRISLASRSPLQLDRAEAKIREGFDVPGPAEVGPSRNGKYRRFLTAHLPSPPPPVHLPDPPPQEEPPCTSPPRPT